MAAYTSCGFTDPDRHFSCTEPAVGWYWYAPLREWHTACAAHAETRSLPLSAEDSEPEYVSRCPACGDPIDYCLGHGEIGDPAGAAILADHDAGVHDRCHPDGCDERGGAVND